ncbi:MAG: hypothetical protein K2X62_06880, partial [Beijerinckiaceae bacterium]|nr:hypothetical protein [Beijerinckiaceae bacterium]
MKLLSLGVLAFSLLSLFLGARGLIDGALLLGVVGLLCAFTTWRSQTISSFLKIFVADNLADLSTRMRSAASLNS